MYQGALLSVLVVSTVKNGNDRLRKGNRQGRKKAPPLYVITGTYRTVFSFPELLNFAVDPENHTET